MLPPRPETTARYVLRTPRNTIMGIFSSEYDAMRTAQDAGGLGSAHDDEGGAQFAVLSEGWSVEKLERKYP